MGTVEEEIARIEDEIANTKYNKATQGHIGRLKAKVAKLKEEMRERAARSGSGTGYAVKKSGHATVGLVGLPSSGKSTLLNLLTGANSEVGDYAFTTVDIIPGVLEHKGAQMQFLDMPGLIEGASTGKGRGKEVLSAARSLDLILIMVDIFDPRLKVVLNELYESGIRINQEPPNVVIRGTSTGGVTVATTAHLSKMTEEEVQDMVRSFGMVNAEVIIREDIDQDQLIDALTGNRIYTKAMAVINKLDLHQDQERLESLRKKYKELDPVFISAEEGTGIDELKDAVYEKLDFIRLYMKPPGGSKADMEKPLVIKRGSTVEDVCNFLHRDLADRFRYAQVTGKSSKYPSQTVGADHVLKEGDILTIIAKK